VKWILPSSEHVAAAERFDAKVTVLIENVRHHVEKKKARCFPKVREAMGAQGAPVLGERWRAKAIRPSDRNPRRRTPARTEKNAGPSAAAVDGVLDVAREVSAARPGRGVDTCQADT